VVAADQIRVNVSAVLADQVVVVQEMEIMLEGQPHRAKVMLVGLV
jgi:hypothetical protein